ncbi:MAG: NAD(P)-dependent oxidoreductase [Hyphomicrobium sp.]
MNAPSTPETRYFFNKDVIEKLPQGAIVVNTARGDLVKDEDMIAALKSGPPWLCGPRCVRGRAQDQRGLLRPAEYVPVSAPRVGGHRGAQPDGL